MKSKYGYITIGIIAVLTLTALQLPSSDYSRTPAVNSTHFHAADDGYGHISEISYQWQEINGFCHWAASTMALRSIGVDLDLHELFVVSGIGLSAAYIRYEATMLMLPGAMYRQMVPLSYVSEFYGIDYDVFIDSSLEIGDVYSQAMGVWGLNYTEINGSSDAFDLLRTSVDDGYPLLIWTDPYYLPAEDYAPIRALGLHSSDTGSGHSVLVVGYNDTSETAWIADPGVGSFGDNFGYPDDGRWYYNISYSDLNLGWRSLSYGSTLLRPGEDSEIDYQTSLADFICKRLEGERTSYAAGQEDLFFVTFGADAFRAMSLDMNPDGLSLLLDNYNTHESRVVALATVGISTESTITLQYLSYRQALETLPSLLHDWDLEEAIARGSEALPHFEALSDNTTLISFDLSNYTGTILWDTFVSLAREYDSSNDLTTAITTYAENLTIIASHLAAIADSWDALAQALRAALSATPLDEILPVIGASTALAVIVITAVVLRRRR